VKNANVFQNGNNAWERDVKWTERLRERVNDRTRGAEAVRGAGNGVLAHLRPLGLLIRECARKHTIYMCVCGVQHRQHVCPANDRVPVVLYWECFRVSGCAYINIIYYYVPLENSTDSQCVCDTRLSVVFLFLNRKPIVRPITESIF